MNYYLKDGREGHSVSMEELYGAWRSFTIGARDSINEFKDEILGTWKAGIKKNRFVNCYNLPKIMALRLLLLHQHIEKKYVLPRNLKVFLNALTLIGREMRSTIVNPDAEIFLTACEKAGICSNHGVVFEDSAAVSKLRDVAEITSFCWGMNITIFH